MALQEELELQGNWLFRYRSILPITILSIGVLVYISRSMLREHFSINRILLAPLENLCLFISLAGIFIRVYTVGHTPAGTSGRNTQNQVADSLNQTVYIYYSFVIRFTWVTS
ncbi:MAG: hypothetical protein V8R91_21195 [Butyricimonas faecihominis]